MHLERKCLFGVSLVLLVLINCVRTFHLGGNGFARGGGSAQKDEEYAVSGKKGDEGYLGFHETEKGAKGYHDKERNKGFYGEVGGNKKAYNDDSGYYKENNRGSKGKNGFNYADRATWAKGHNTKGSHSIHKLDELKKKTEFFDEDNDQSFKEKHGAYDKKSGFKKGSKDKGGAFKKGFFEAAFGLGGGFEKGSHNFDDQGHNNEKGQNEYYSNEEKYNKAGGSGLFKKWGFGNR